MLASVENRARRWLYGRDLAVWYSPEYRWPLSALEARTGLQNRRADFAAWYLLERRALARGNLRRPRRAEYEELARVHTPELLDSLGQAETLARIFGVDPGDVPVDEMMNTVRLACGATIAAARELISGLNPRSVVRRALNLSGGFHHARRDVAGGFCPVNDVAVAVAAVRADGFTGRVLILDLDAHPPDGIAACLTGDPSWWIGSISGSDWGTIAGVDETVLPERAGDAEYLAALDALLRRMPEGELAFVLAGGDVLAGTGLALGIRSRASIAPEYDPLLARFSAIARSLAPEDLGEPATDSDDIAEDLGIATRRRLLLGFYSAEGLEHALHRYGILGELRRMGYGPFRVRIEHGGVGQSVLQ